ncbi:MAG: hypothetical protein MZV63_14685 [Marinilabiliales bacterium]|nr:hypothetical protein [Marinilabiliales bacterium]
MPFYELAFILSPFPVISILLRLAVNRNGVLILSETDDLLRVQKFIDVSAREMGYAISRRAGNTIEFEPNSRWNKFLNFFFREGLRLTIEADSLIIFGKRNVLKLVESDIRKVFQ